METIIFKLEVLDHRARERAGVITPTLGTPIPVLLSFDAAVEVNIAIFFSVYKVLYCLFDIVILFVCNFVIPCCLLDCKFHSLQSERLCACSLDIFQRATCQFRAFDFFNDICSSLVHCSFDFPVKFGENVHIEFSDG